MSKERSIQTMSIDGNCLVFNFINTVHSRTEDDEPFEYLSSYKKLLEWCERLEVLPLDRIKKLSAFSDSHPETTARSLKEIIVAREMLYRFFSNIAAGEPVGESDLDAFNQLLSKSLKKLRFISEGKNVRLDWEDEEPDLKEPIWRVMKSAYDVLTEEAFERIKECEACGWVFLDQSKNRSRRWCSMESCGSNYKAKKYYHRKKKEEEKNDYSISMSATGFRILYH
jgi:predicted RNA-binding Zn ribbon-like protein